ncbi:MAG: hypothetical protein WBP28_07835, partial [Nostocoides sp.]
MGLDDAADDGAPLPEAVISGVWLAPGEVLGAGLVGTVLGSDRVLDASGGVVVSPGRMPRSIQ